MLPTTTQDATFGLAVILANTSPLEWSSVLCDVLRQLERDVPDSRDDDRVMSLVVAQLIVRLEYRARCGEWEDQ